LKGPAKIHLDDPNLVARKGEDFGVTSPAAINICHLIRHDQFIARLDDPNEVELLALPRAWPAAIKVTRAIQSNIERAGKRELAGEGPLDQVAIARREGTVDVAYDLRSARRAVLLGVMTTLILTTCGLVLALTDSAFHWCTLK